MNVIPPVRWVLLLSLLVILGGCAWAPGGHIAERTSSAPVEDLVDIEPITFGLIRAQETRSVPPDLRRVSDEMAQDVAEYDYRIGRGDVLAVIVYEHPELTIPAGSERSAVESGNTVHPDGTIFYPYIGRVEVEGYTVSQVRDRIARDLATFVNEPQVEVRVAAFNSQKVQVTGSVREPGVQPVTNVPLTVLDAIHHSGGLSDDANWHEVILTREGEEIVISLYDMLRYGDMSQNRLLRDGDVLHVPDTAGQQVYVMGEVGDPQRLPLGRGQLTLMDALSQAGGFNENRADASGIFVIRRAPPESDKLATVYQLDARNSAALMLGAEFELEPLDIVYVTTTSLGRWNRVISQLLPTVSAVYQSSRTTRDVRRLSDDF
ncbi:MULTISPECIES: polysaccharide export protein [unclassified Thioalkalivibrio]|uniref:polysaccharide export protein n=1 Tax=unclassified Thioalkalivibrio TaxID=2621013 RepID=UPI000371AC2A|nr:MULTISPECIES: polysaccharide export protein [unclassified Thioalkalivibrio]